jgi:hypothetical protein
MKGQGNSSEPSPDRNSFHPWQVLRAKSGVHGAWRIEGKVGFGRGSGLEQLIIHHQRVDNTTSSTRSSRLQCGGRRYPVARRTMTLNFERFLHTAQLVAQHDILE